MERQGIIQRQTNETKVRVELDLDGVGQGASTTGIGFFDHLLDAFRRHGLLNLKVETQGDLHIDGHHTVEDTGISIGLALHDALGDCAGITRFGSSYCPLDEALARAVVDISGRGGFYMTTVLPLQRVGEFDGALLPEFLRALVTNAKITLHLDILKGENQHHMQEAAIKAFARALRQAVQIDPRQKGIPSTKGVLR